MSSERPLSGLLRSAVLQQAAKDATAEAVPCEPEPKQSKAKQSKAIRRLQSDGLGPFSNNSSAMKLDAGGRSWVITSEV